MTMRTIYCFLSLLLLTIKIECLQAPNRATRVTPSSLQPHTIEALSKIENVCSIADLYMLGEEIPAIKLSVDKAIRIVTCDAEDAILASRAVQQFATLYSMPSTESSARKTFHSFDGGRRFEQLMECVDLKVEELRVADVARYVWGLTVLGSTDHDKYRKVLMEYASRLNQYIDSREVMRIPARGNGVTKRDDQGVVELSVADVAAMVWTTACIKDANGPSDSTFVREASQVLSDLLHFETSASTGTGTGRPPYSGLSSHLAVRTIWSLATHGVFNKPLVMQCLALCCNEESAQALTISNTLSLLWSLSEFKIVDLKVYHALLGRVMQYLQTTDTDAPAYEQEFAAQSLQLLRTLHTVRGLCEEIVLTDPHASASALSILQQIQKIEATTLFRIEPHLLASGNMLALPSVISYLFSRAQTTCSLDPECDNQLLEVCLETITIALDNHAISVNDCTNLLVALSASPAHPMLVSLQAGRAESLAPISTSAVASGPSLRFRRAFLREGVLRSHSWQRELGRLAETAATHLPVHTETATGAEAADAADAAAVATSTRAQLLDAAWALCQLDHVHLPLLRSLRAATLVNPGTLSADDTARLAVIFQHCAQSQSRSQPHSAFSALDPDLASGNAYLQQVARLAESKLAGVTEVPLFAQVLQVLRVVLYPLPSLPTTPAQGDIGNDTITGQEFPARGVEESPPGGRSLADITATTNEGFNVFSFEEEEGVKTDSERLRALVSSAAKGKTAASNLPVEPGVVIAQARWQNLPLGQLVRTSYALQFLPSTTVSVTTLRHLHEEIQQRWREARAVAVAVAVAVSGSQKTNMETVHEDVLNDEEEAMLARLWLKDASMVSTGQAAEVFTSLLRRSSVIATDIGTDTDYNTDTDAEAEAEAGTEIWAVVCARALRQCRLHIDAVQTLSSADHYLDGVARSSEAFLTTLTLLTAGHDTRQVFTASTASTASTAECELHFQSGVLQEALRQYPRLSHRAPSSPSSTPVPIGSTSALSMGKRLLTRFFRSFVHE